MTPRSSLSCSGQSTAAQRGAEVVRLPREDPGLPIPSKSTQSSPLDGAAWSGSPRTSVVQAGPGCRPQDPQWLSWASRPGWGPLGTRQLSTGPPLLPIRTPTPCSRRASEEGRHFLRPLPQFPAFLASPGRRQVRTKEGAGVWPQGSWHGHTARLGEQTGPGEGQQGPSTASPPGEAGDRRPSGREFPKNCTVRSTGDRGARPSWGLSGTQVPHARLWEPQPSAPRPSQSQCPCSSGRRRWWSKDSA